MMNVSNRVSCCELFKILNILPQHSQYILLLLLFVVKKMDEFKSPSTLTIGLIYFLHQQNLLNITKLSTTQGLKFTTTDFKVLKTYPGMSKILN
jgi:hypothetical protein